MTVNRKLRTGRRGESMVDPSPADMESSRRIGNILLWLGIIAPVCFYAAVVLLAPVDVFDQYPGLKSRSDWVRNLLLARSGSRDIYTHARSTTFPQAAMFSAAMGIYTSWIGAATMAFHGVLNFKENAYFVSKQPSDSLKQRIMGAFVLPIAGLFSMWAFYCLKGDPSFAAGLTTHSRGGYLVMSVAAICLFIIGIGNALFCFRFLFYKPLRG